MSARPVMLLEPLGRGGIADYTGELSAALAARGMKVHVVTASDHLYEGGNGVEVTGVVRWLRDRTRFTRGCGARGWPRSSMRSASPLCCLGS